MAQRTPRGRKRKALHTLPQPRIQPRRVVANWAADDAEADAEGDVARPQEDRERPSSDRGPPLPPRLRAPPVPPPAPCIGCTGVPRKEGTLHTSALDGALQPSLAPAGGGGVRVPRTHPDAAVVSCATGAGTEGSVPALARDT